VVCDDKAEAYLNWRLQRHRRRCGPGSFRHSGISASGIPGKS